MSEWLILNLIGIVGVVNLFTQPTPYLLFLLLVEVENPVNYLAFIFISNNLAQLHKFFEINFRQRRLIFKNNYISLRLQKEEMYLSTHLLKSILW